ncbi:RNA polymerase sigma factor [Planctomycetota bacterium]
MFEDKLLILRFNRGNMEPLRRIYEKYKDDLVTLAAALLYDKTLAEDAVHDCFAGFIKSAGTFKLTGSLKAYLSVCVANKARDKNRSATRARSIGLDQVQNVLSDENSPAVAVAFDEQSRRVTDALTLLPDDQRETVVLHLNSGLKFRQIAQMHNVSINTIQGRYRYGLEKLRSLLNGEVKKPSCHSREGGNPVI